MHAGNCLHQCAKWLRQVVGGKGADHVTRIRIAGYRRREKSPSCLPTIRLGAPGRCGSRLNHRLLEIHQVPASPQPVVEILVGLRRVDYRYRYPGMLENTRKPPLRRRGLT